MRVSRTIFLYLIACMFFLLPGQGLAKKMHSFDGKELDFIDANTIKSEDGVVFKEGVSDPYKGKFNGKTLEDPDSIFGAHKNGLWISTKKYWYRNGIDDAYYAISWNENDEFLIYGITQPLTRNTIIYRWKPLYNIEAKGLKDSFKKVTGQDLKKKELWKKGSLTGKIEAVDKWGADPDKILPGERIEVLDMSDRAIGYAEIQGSKSDGFYYETAFTSLDHGGLYYPGQYKIKYYSQDDLEGCDTSKEQWVGLCKQVWRGTVSFSIDDDGKINIPKPDDDNEKWADGKKLDGLTNKNGINLSIKEMINSPLYEALGNAVKWLVDTLNKTIYYLTGWVKKVLDEANNFEDMQPAWRLIRDIALSLLTLGIVIIAFANVLNLDIEKYGAQRIIPKLVIGVLLTYFSFLISSIFVEAADVLTTQFRESLSIVKGANNGEIYNISLDIEKLSGSEIVEQVGTILFMAILLIGVVIALIYLTLLLLMRIVVINFLVVVAPVAFILGIMPFTESLSKRWWSTFSQWVFMGPAVMGMLLIGNVIIFTTFGTPEAMKPAENLDGDLSFLDGPLAVATAAVAYFLAAQIPMMMAGEAKAALGKWSGMVNKGMRWTGAKAGSQVAAGVKATGLPAAWQQRKGVRQARREHAQQERGAGIRAAIGKTGGVGRWAAGFKSEAEMDNVKRQIFLSALNEKKKELADLDTDELNEVLAKGTGMERQASLQLLAEHPIGIVGRPELEENADAEDIAKYNKALAQWQLQQDALKEFMPKDKALKGSLLKEHLGPLADGIADSPDKEKFKTVAIGQISKKNVETDLKAAHVKALVSIATGKTGDEEKFVKSASAVLKNYTAGDIQSIKNTELRKAFKDIATANPALLNAETLAEINRQLPDDQAPAAPTNQTETRQERGQSRFDG